MRARVRFLVDGLRSGPWNMGVDEALLASAASDGLATLRLYRWRGPWLSLGYAQTLAPARLAACARAGVRVVRRPTGGRAVLHGSDLTYALAAPADWFPEGIHASYRRVSDALVTALRELGVAAARARAGSARGNPVAFDCFAEPAPDEICVEGRKLVGSAQRRAGGALLQHGSIRLFPDAATAARAAGLGAGATSLAELGVEAVPGRAGHALARAFATALGVELRSGRLTGLERELARRRAHERRLEPVVARARPSQGFSRALFGGR